MEWLHEVEHEVDYYERVCDSTSLLRWYITSPCQIAHMNTSLYTQGNTNILRKLHRVTLSQYYPSLSL